MKRWRVVLCGADGTALRVVASHLTRAQGFEHRDLVIVDSLDPGHLMPLAREADSPQAAIILSNVQSATAPAIRWQLHLVLALGFHRAIVALDNNDLVDQSQSAFTHVQRECVDIAAMLRVSPVAYVPISVASGENITEHTDRMPWYRGATLLDSIEQLRVPDTERDRVKLASADQFEASIVWTADRPMLQSRSYEMRLGETRVWATVAPLKYRVDATSSHRAPAKTLSNGDLGVCNLELELPIPFDLTARRFVLVDPVARETVGVGLLHFALYRSQNVQRQELDINKERRAALMGQKPCVIWFTGLSGAGKSTIANLVEKRLHARGRHTYMLDGDNVRHGLSKDLGFTDADRVENIRRVAEVARLMVDAGLVVIVSFISPFRSERRMARSLVGPGEFVEVFVDTPLDVAESRDPKGLYGKARRGELRNFTGIDSPYEAPEHPDIRLDTTRLSAEESAEAVIEHLERKGIVRSGARLSREQQEH